MYFSYYEDMRGHLRIENQGKNMELKKRKQHKSRENYILEECHR
jgi:hypothetical protein